MSWSKSLKARKTARSSTLQNIVERKSETTVSKMHRQELAHTTQRSRAPLALICGFALALLAKEVVSLPRNYVRFAAPAPKALARVAVPKVKSERGGEGFPG